MTSTDRAAPARSGPRRLLSDADDVRELLRAGRRAARAPLAIDPRLAPVGEGRLIADRLSNLGAECGCTLGAQTMSIALVVAGAALVAAGDVRSTGFLLRLPLVVAAGIAGAGAGKAVGVVLAGRRFRRELELLLARVPSGPSVVRPFHPMEV